MQLFRSVRSIFFPKSKIGFSAQVFCGSPEFSLTHKGWSMWKDIAEKMVSSCFWYQRRSHIEEMDFHENRRDFGQILDTLSWQWDVMQMDLWWKTTVELFPRDFYKWGGQPSVDNALKSCLGGGLTSGLLRFLPALSPANGEYVKQSNYVVFIDK